MNSDIMLANDENSYLSLHNEAIHVSCPLGWEGGALILRCFKRGGEGGVPYIIRHEAVATITFNMLSQCYRCNLPLPLFSTLI